LKPRAKPSEKSHDKDNNPVLKETTVRKNSASAQAAFDLCLQDDSSGDKLQINSTTGEYFFTRCRDIFSIGGVQRLTVRSCGMTLQQALTDRRLSASIDTCQKTGIASIQVFSLGETTTITDRDISNNTCVCPLPPGIVIEDIPPVPPQSDDPAVTGGPLDPTVVRNHSTPLEFQGEPAFDMKEKMVFLPDSNTSLPLINVLLQPLQTHQITIPMRESASLFAKADWFGSAGPVRLIFVKDGVTLASGVSQPAISNRGTAMITALVDAAGNVTLSVINETASTLNVQIVIGAQPPSS
jgi:hypothetical protein